VHGTVGDGIDDRTHITGQGVQVISARGCAAASVPAQLGNHGPAAKLRKYAEIVLGDIGHPGNEYDRGALGVTTGVEVVQSHARVLDEM